MPFANLSAQSSGLSRVEAAVKSLAQDPDMRSANWGLAIRDAQSGRLLFGYESERNLATASTMKAVSTATALGVLGPNFRFETRIEYVGSLSSDGVLEGDLIIRGGGDPTLGSDRFGKPYQMATIFYDWAQKVKQAGIKEIQGRVIGDEGTYSSQLTPGNWGWEDMGNYYGAGAGGLNVHENLYRLDLKPGARTGDRTKVLRTDPEIPRIQFYNELTTGRPGSGDNAYIYGAPYTYGRYLRGTIPAGVSSFSIKGSIPDPALFCADQFKEVLQACEVAVVGQANTSRRLKLMGENLPEKGKLVHRHFSPTLADIVIPTNMKSINLYAEALANQVAQAREGDNREVGEAMKKYWQSQGVNTRGMYLRDGSGLSPNNQLSTGQLSAILCKVYQSGYYQSFNQSLPVAGKSGSLSRMMRGTKAANNLRAKSGYISGVRSYTGYVEDGQGRTLAFTFIVNYFSGSSGQMRNKMANIMALMAN
ncbi:MAG: D-alanyl-D-alanine carboxypeptidase/D-alanyl-D-alanine-endopeptidase [Bacteroidota bacterium]